MMTEGKSETRRSPELPKATATGFVERTLLHYDIHAADATTRRRIDRYLYGYRQTKASGGTTKEYVYPGLVERTGGRHYGQSVVILPADAAEEAIRVLRELHVSYEKADILAPIGS